MTKFHRTLIRLGGVHRANGKTLISGIIPGWNSAQAVRLRGPIVDFIDRLNLDTGDYLYARVNIEAEYASAIETQEPFEFRGRISKEELWQNERLGIWCNG